MTATPSGRPGPPDQPATGQPAEAAAGGAGD